MYGWIWRHLPGPVGAKLALAVVLFLGVVALLLFVVFPCLDPLLPFNKVSVQ
ncbi:hypothetical protein [Saccharopolyspora hattusasensis]|uniref:hypothetical protein n=1 Tax=Saccharopolyspora hattusasensis TaxID=1128679 RepID=UPI003D9988A9